MSRARRVAYIFMLGLIAKLLLLSEYGPFDRLLEMGVVALILYEVIAGISHRRKENQKQDRLMKLTTLWLDGTSLSRRQPLPNSTEEVKTQFCKSVEVWIENTRLLLERCPRPVQLAFSDPGGIVGYTGTTNTVEEASLTLNQKLSNLNNIIYFPTAFM